MLDSSPTSDVVSSPTSSSPSSFRRVKKRITITRRLRESLVKHNTLSLVVLLSLIVSSSLLAVGTVHAAPLLVIAPLASITGAYALFTDQNGLRKRLIPGAIAMALGFVCLLQSLPLPSTVLRSLSPVAAQVWLDAFRLTNVPTNHWASISLDPSASRLEAIKWCSYGAAFLGALRLARDKGAQPGVLIVAASALLAGLLSVFHGLAGIDRWLGIYEPQMARPVWAVTPLLNPNNFAGYLNLAAFSALGLLFLRRPLIPRLGVALVLVFLFAFTTLTGSRGGILAMLAGLVLSGVAFRGQQQRAQRRGAQVLPVWIPLTGVALAAMALATAGLNATILRSVLDETTTKLRMADYTLPVIRDYPWTGIGRGAFETVFPAYRKDPGNIVHQYAENFLVQWVVEWGFPVSAIALGGLLWSLWPGRLGFGRGALATSIPIAIVVLLGQNLVDLGTEIASVGLATFTLLGTLVGGAEHHEGERLTRRNGRGKEPAPKNISTARPSHRAAAAVSSCYLFLHCGLIGVVALTTSLDAIGERDQLSKLSLETAGKPPTDIAYVKLLDRVRAALLRHPADPYVPLVGALAARDTMHSAMPWLNQALRRDPLNARAHLLLADTLIARGAKKQSLAAMRRAVELGPELIAPAAERIARWCQSTEEMLIAVPQGATGIPLLTSIAGRVGVSQNRRATRDALLEEALLRDTERQDTNRILAYDLLFDLDNANGNCQGDRRIGCENRFQAHAKIVMDAGNSNQTSLSMRARVLAHANKLSDAERLLAELCTKVPDPASCQEERVSYALKLDDADRFEKAASALVQVACSSAEHCSKTYGWLGELDLARGNPRTALAKFERAAHEYPTAKAWLRVAEVAMQLGRYSRARSALVAAKRMTKDGSVELFESRLTDEQRNRLAQAQSVAMDPGSNLQ